MKYTLNELYNGDCMEAMREMPDGFFELAIVDPPYGINAEGGTGKYGKRKFRSEKAKTWDAGIPPPEYFAELRRVSQNQIIFGGNYFAHLLPPSRCWVAWDKGAGFYNRNFAECELAWTSFDRNAKVFNYDPLAHRDYVDKIHPCQKPVAVYTWLLQNFANAGDKILDTHVGSASSLIACHNCNFDFLGFEKDADIYARAAQRLEAERAQLRFDVFCGGGGDTVNGIIITAMICLTIIIVCAIGYKKK